jgi:hypothetical protein
LGGVRIKIIIIIIIMIAEAKIYVGKLKHFFECADVEDMCALKSILTLENSLDQSKL